MKLSPLLTLPRLFLPVAFFYIWAAFLDLVGNYFFGFLLLDFLVPLFVGEIG